MLDLAIQACQLPSTTTHKCRGSKAVGRGSASTEQGQEVHEEKAPILSPLRPATLTAYLLSKKKGHKWKFWFLF